MLRDQRVSAFPVIDEDNRVIGIVSETDLLAKEALEGTERRRDPDRHCDPLRRAERVPPAGRGDTARDHQ